MKKSILSIALLSMLFVLGACSALDGDFLDKVKGKSVYSDEAQTSESILGKFSDDGETFQLEKSLNGYETKFDKASDENTGKYNYKSGDAENESVTVKTTDGKIGTISTTEKPVITDRPIWLK